jgi:hypothetical protein
MFLIFHLVLLKPRDKKAKERHSEEITEENFSFSRPQKQQTLGPPSACHRGAAIPTRRPSPAALRHAYRGPMHPGRTFAYACGFLSLAKMSGVVALR